MSHLSEEQFEDLLAAPSRRDAHVDACPQCRGHLEELRATRARLRSAFESVRAPAYLAERIRSAAGQAEQAPSPRRAISFLRHHLRPLVAAAAALVAAAVPLAIYLASGSSAEAAQQALVDIHRHNVSDSHEFYSQNEPNELARYFVQKLGFSPALPRLNQGIAIRGCCVARFRDRIVGSYVVDTPKGVVSLIAVTDAPPALGLVRQSGPGGRQSWRGAMTTCHIAALQMGKYTYCAVGEVPADTLDELLSLLAGGADR